MTVPEKRKKKNRPVKNRFNVCCQLNLLETPPVLKGSSYFQVLLSLIK